MTKLFPNGLKSGAKGPLVNMLALLLRAVGFDDDHNIRFDQDFTPGGKIEAALREYQELSGLEVTGELDQPTLNEFATDLEVEELTVEMFFGETCPA